MFRIEFNCINCGHSWSSVFEDNTRVEEKTLGARKGVSVTKNPNKLPDKKEEYRVECKGCSLKRHVRVDDRLGKVKGTK